MNQTRHTNAGLCEKKSILNRLQIVQSKTVRTLTRSPFYIRNDFLHSEDLRIPTVIESAETGYEKYRTKLIRRL